MMRIHSYKINVSVFTAKSKLSVFVQKSVSAKYFLEQNLPSLFVKEVSKCILVTKHKFFDLYF